MAITDTNTRDKKIAFDGQDTKLSVDNITIESPDNAIGVLRYEREENSDRSNLRDYTPDFTSTPNDFSFSFTPNVEYNEERTELVVYEEEEENEEGAENCSEEGDETIKFIEEETLYYGLE